MISDDQDIDSRIMVLTAKGRLTFPEIRSKMGGFALAGIPSNVLCDFRRATVADLTNREIEDIIKIVGRQVRRYRVKRAAIVAHGSVDLGLARMLSTLSEIADLPIKVKAFRTAEIARSWLCTEFEE
jgi:hypothetical protein